MTDGYEYGIGLSKWTADMGEFEPHRCHMTEEEAVEWLVQWKDMAGTNMQLANLFKIIRRPIGGWEDA